MICCSSLYIHTYLPTHTPLNHFMNYFATGFAAGLSHRLFAGVKAAGFLPVSNVNEASPAQDHCRRICSSCSRVFLYNSFRASGPLLVWINAPKHSGYRRQTVDRATSIKSQNGLGGLLVYKYKYIYIYIYIYRGREGNTCIMHAALFTSMTILTSMTKDLILWQHYDNLYIHDKRSNLMAASVIIVVFSEINDNL